ncbi:uncharacterized protein LOC144003001 isoform X1 [Festucalex cinctus]
MDDAFTGVRHPQQCSQTKALAMNQMGPKSMQGEPVKLTLQSIKCNRTTVLCFSFRCVPVGVVHRVTWARSEVERYTKCPECKMNGFIALEHSQTKVLVDVVRLEEQSHQHYRESMSFVLLAVFVSTLSPTHWVCTNSH